MSLFRTRTVLLALAWVVAALAPTQADAQVIASSFSNPAAAAFGAYSGNPIAQQFTITSAAQLSSIDLSLQRIVGTPTLATVTMGIYDDNAGNLGTTLLYSPTGTTGTLSGSPAAINFQFASIVLNPGTYWVQLFNSDTSSNRVGWQSQTSYASTGTLGSINARYFNGTTYNTTTSAMTQLNGVAAVPEPSTWILSSFALLAFGPLARRRAR